MRPLLALLLSALACFGSTVTFTITNSDTTPYSGPLWSYPIGSNILADGSFSIRGVPQRTTATNGLASFLQMRGTYYASNANYKLCYAVPADSGTYAAESNSIPGQNVFVYRPGVDAATALAMIQQYASTNSGAVPAGVVTNNQTGVNLAGSFAGDGSGVTNLTTVIPSQFGYIATGAVNQNGNYPTFNLKSSHDGINWHTVQAPVNFWGSGSLYFSSLAYASNAVLMVYDSGDGYSHTFPDPNSNQFAFTYSTNFSDWSAAKVFTNPTPNMASVQIDGLSWYQEGGTNYLFFAGYGEDPTFLNKFMGYVTVLTNLSGGFTPPVAIYTNGIELGASAKINGTYFLFGSQANVDSQCMTNTAGPMFTFYPFTVSWPALPDGETMFFTACVQVNPTTWRLYGNAVGDGYQKTWFMDSTNGVNWSTPKAINESSPNLSYPGICAAPLPMQQLAEHATHTNSVWGSHDRVFVASSMAGTTNTVARHSLMTGSFARVNYKIWGKADDRDVSSVFDVGYLDITVIVGTSDRAASTPGQFIVSCVTNAAIMSTPVFGAAPIIVDTNDAVALNLYCSTWNSADLGTYSPNITWKVIETFEEGEEYWRADGADWTPAAVGATNVFTLPTSLPKWSKAQRAYFSGNGFPISPGSAIYQTDNTPGLRVWNGAHWMRFTETADD